MRNVIINTVGILLFIPALFIIIMAVAIMSKGAECDKIGKDVWLDDLRPVCIEREVENGSE